MRYITALLQTLRTVLGILIPRFMTETVAVIEGPAEDEYTVVAPVDLLEPGDRYDGTIQLTVFNLFGFGLFPHAESEFVPGPYRPAA